MNRSKRFVIFLLVAALIGVTLAGHVMQATANTTGEVTVVVSNSSQLYSALLNAKDGDIIGLDGFINISTNTIVGDSDKHVTLRRMTDLAHINVLAGSTTTFQNITFDGDMIPAAYALVVSNGNITIENVNFKNGNTINAGEGGAVSLHKGTANISNSKFSNNSAIEGGHVLVGKEVKVTIENSVFENGHADSNGGAIKNNSDGQHHFTIRDSVIRGNSAGSFGGGISNNGYLIIYNTKIYGNTATTGGADIAKTLIGVLNNHSTIEVLTELLKEDGIKPLAWVNDYDFETSPYLPDIILPHLPNSLLKLEYELLPTEVILVPTSLGTAGDGKITNLESEKYYKVIADDVISYSKADGTLTLDETEAEALIGTEIIGLINGMVYLVEEYIPAQEEEPATDDDEEQPDKQEPEESESPSELGNDEESNNEEEQENQEENPSSPDEDEDIEQPDDNNEQEETEPIEQDDDKAEQDKGSQKEDKTETNNQNTTTTTTSSNTTTNANTTDSSSTVNNYSYVDDHSTHTTHNSLPGALETTSREPNTMMIEQPPITQEQTVRIEAGSATNESVIIKETGQGITINVNVTVDSEPKQNSVYDEVQTAKLISNFEPAQSAEQQENGIHWLDVIKLCLLFGIFVAVIRK